MPRIDLKPLMHLGMLLPLVALLAVVLPRQLGPSVSLPRAQTPETRTHCGPSSPVTIALRDGRPTLFWENEVTDLDGLRARARAERRPIMLLADAELRFGSVRPVVEAFTDASLNVSLVARD